MLVALAGEYSVDSCRRNLSSRSSLRSCFNPRTPRGVRHGDGDEGAGGFVVSIHAPRAGCDEGVPSVIPVGRVFQSTHPARGATCGLRGRIPIVFVSIHAPRAGCDTIGWGLVVLVTLFQSTHPARGATPDLGWLWPVCQVFQSTHPARGAT